MMSKYLLALWVALSWSVQATNIEKEEKPSRITQRTQNGPVVKCVEETLPRIFIRLIPDEIGRTPKNFARIGILELKQMIFGSNRAPKTWSQLGINIAVNTIYRSTSIPLFLHVSTFTKDISPCNHLFGAGALFAYHILKETFRENSEEILKSPFQFLIFGGKSLYKGSADSVEFVKNWWTPHTERTENQDKQLSAFKESVHSHFTRFSLNEFTRLDFIEGLNLNRQMHRLKRKLRNALAEDQFQNSNQSWTAWTANVALDIGYGSYFPSVFFQTSNLTSSYLTGTTSVFLLHSLKETLKEETNTVIENTFKEYEEAQKSWDKKGTTDEPDIFKNPDALVYGVTVITSTLGMPVKIGYSLVANLGTKAHHLYDWIRDWSY